MLITERARFLPGSLSERAGLPANADALDGDLTPRIDALDALRPAVVAINDARRDIDAGTRPNDDMGTWLDNDNSTIVVAITIAVLEHDVRACGARKACSCNHSSHGAYNDFFHECFPRF
jgi:hypothetical protein